MTLNIGVPPDEQRLGLGGNNPPSPIDDRPYAEIMLEGSASMRERAEQLIAGLNNSRIDSRETAEAVTTLAGLIRDHMAVMEARRVELREPHRKAAQDVQDAYKPSIDALDAAIKQAGDMVSRWRSQERAREEAERRRREEEAAEARRKAEEAEAAQRAAEKAGDGAGALQAELAALKARDEAAAADHDAQTVRPQEMIRSQVASAGARTERVPQVDDLTKCLAFLRQPRYRGQLLEAITPLIGRFVRAKIDIPGVSVVEREKTVFRR